MRRVFAALALTLLAGIAPRALQTPEGLAKFQQAEIDKWWPIIKEACIGMQAQ